jgi:hypothetical protein
MFNVLNERSFHVCRTRQAEVERHDSAPTISPEQKFRPRIVREGWMEASMALLMLRCPMTDRNYSTGINTDVGTLTRIQDISSASVCPHCKRHHDWRLNDAWLAEAVPLHERIVGHHEVSEEFSRIG